MKRILARTLCAIALAGIGTTASAVPIYFDFTGTITSADGSYAHSGLEGTTVSGGITLETGDLTSFLSLDLARAQYFSWPISNSEGHLDSALGSVSFPFY